MSSVLDYNWDVLIVLDACRYDFFEPIINRFATGKIIGIISPGSCTLEWLCKTFRDKYEDIIYVSGNPFVNKRHAFGDRLKFEPYIHFDIDNIIESFKKCWNYPGTTDPVCLTIEAFKAILKRYHNTSKNSLRFIVHYLQPHAPYLDYRYPNYERNPIVWAKSSSRRYLRNKSKWYRRALHIYGILERKMIEHNIPNIPLYIIRQILGFPPPFPTDEFRRLYGIGELRKAYLHNLIRVLKSSLSLVKILKERLNLNVAITSDHGEGLGDKLWIDHPCYKNFDFLRKVFIFYPHIIKIYDKRLYNKLRLIYRLYKKLSM